MKRVFRFLELRWLPWWVCFLFIWIALGIRCLVDAAVATPTPPHALYWPYPTNAFSADLVFNFYETTNVALPQPWTLFGSVSATNLVWTNLDSTGTNAVLSWPIPPLIPGQYYFYAVPANFWMTAGPSNTAQTPPLTPLIQFPLGIR